MIAGRGAPATRRVDHADVRGTTEPSRTGSAPGEAGAVGWLPIATLVVAFGVVAIGVAHRLSEAGTWDAQLLFWLGVLLITAPPVIRQLSTGPSRDERVALVVLCGLGLFCVKL